MNNKKLGNSFENELCEILSRNGFWVHCLTQNKAGQPADIIAVKNGKAYLIDAKVCSGDKFSFDRVEENQDLAMELWSECGNTFGYFAIKIEGQIYMVTHYSIKAHRNLKSYMSAEEIFKDGKPLERWIKWVNKCK